MCVYIFVISVYAFLRKILSHTVSCRKPVSAQKALSSSPCLNRLLTTEAHVALLAWSKQWVTPAPKIVNFYLTTIKKQTRRNKSLLKSRLQFLFWFCVTAEAPPGTGSSEPSALLAVHERPRGCWLSCYLSAPCPFPSAGAGVVVLAVQPWVRMCLVRGYRLVYIQDCVPWSPPFRAALEKECVTCGRCVPWGALWIRETHCRPWFKTILSFLV